MPVTDHLFPMKLDVRHSTMSSVLPYDIIAEIIDIVGENDNTILIKELALVSHSFNQICGKYLFATVDLHDAVPMRQASSKKGFVKLLERRPEVVKYIRKLRYLVEYDGSFQSSSFSSTYPRHYDDDLLSPVLPNFLRTISFLNCLTIAGSKLVEWDTIDSSLTSALLHLMHLPTIDHIDLSSIENFPLSSLAASKSPNLRRLDINYLTLGEDDPLENVVLPEAMPKILEFNTSDSSAMAEKLIHAKTQDGQPAFSYMDLRRLSISSSSSVFYQDDLNLQFFTYVMMLNAKLLEKLRFSVACREGFEGVHEIFISPCARILKELDFSLSFSATESLALFEDLEVMARDNMLEVFSLQIVVDSSETDDFIGNAGFTFQKVEEELVKAGWFALRKVSFKVLIICWNADISEALNSLPDKYLSYLPKLESIDFKYEWNIYSYYSDYYD